MGKMEEIKQVMDEVVNALRKIRRGKAVGSDNILDEKWKCLGKFGVKLPRNWFNNIFAGDKIPDEWRDSMLVSIYNKGDIQDCRSY